MPFEPAKTTKPAPTGKVKIFVKIDALNNFPNATGSINGHEYSFRRGTTVEVSPSLAEHMISCDQATQV